MHRGGWRARCLLTGKTDPMHTWRVGDCEVIRVESVDLAVPAPASVPDWMVPEFATAQGEVRVAFSAVAVRTPTKIIVIDPWLADDFPRQGADADDVVTALLNELGTAGIEPEAVNLVINTHCDGIGWNTRPDGHGRWRPSFPNARYIYPATTLVALNVGGEIYGGEGLEELRRLRDIQAITPPHQVTTEVSMLDAPGHDAGHTAIRIESGGDLAIYPGHLVLSPYQIDDPATTLAGESAELLPIATESRRAILDELADRNGLLLATLIGGPGGGRVQRAEGGFRLAVVA